MKYSAHINQRYVHITIHVHATGSTKISIIVSTDNDKRMEKVITSEIRALIVSSTRELRCSSLKAIQSIDIESEVAKLRWNHFENDLAVTNLQCL